MNGKSASIDSAMRWEISDPEPNHRFMGLMFERDITPTKNVAVGFVILPAKQEQKKLSVHERSEEVYIVVQGEGRFVIGEEEVAVKKGSAVYIAPGCPHRAINTGTEELHLVWVNTPPVFGAVEGYKEMVSPWKRVQ
jgi:mannose-6-phosphate isomerase-like protein (cupin superfamily)